MQVNKCISIIQSSQCRQVYEGTHIYQAPVALNAIENHRRQIKSGCSYASLFMEWNARVSCFTPLRLKDAHKTCVNKSLFQALESSPVVFVVTQCHPTCCCANLSTFSLENWKSGGLANAYVDSQNWMQYSASHVATTALLLSQNSLKSNLRASNF